MQVYTVRSEGTEQFGLRNLIYYVPLHFTYFSDILSFYMYLSPCQIFLLVFHYQCIFIFLLLLKCLHTQVALLGRVKSSQVKSNRSAKREEGDDNDEPHYHNKLPHTIIIILPINLSHTFHTTIDLPVSWASFIMN